MRVSPSDLLTLLNQHICKSWRQQVVVRALHSDFCRSILRAQREQTYQIIHYQGYHHKGRYIVYGHELNVFS